MGTASARSRESIEVSRRAAGFLLCFALLGFVLAPQAFAEGRRLALLIGNSAYQKNALPNPVNDAQDFGALLSEAGFEAQVFLNLDLRGMEKAVRDFAGRADEGDTLLVFYAGHGVESGGSNYLIPVDNGSLESEGDLKYKAYPASRILEEAASRKAGLAILILDACRDNPLPSRSGAGSRGLSVMAAPPRLESLILYSTAPGTTAADGAGRNSVFMRSLLAEMQAPELTVRDVFDRVGGAVRAATNGAQVPWLNSTPLSKPFVFFSGADALARAASLGAKAKEDLESQRAKIAELEAARARAKDEAARQKLDTEIATARALEAAKKLESERLAAETARLSEEKKKAEAAALARKNFEASEAARAAQMQEEAARLRKEYENLVRVDDSAPEFLRQINALEKALKEIQDRYEVIRKNGEKGIKAVYEQKSEALNASLVMEPWENEREFKDRTKVSFDDLEKKKAIELASYTASIQREKEGQEKELRTRLDKVSSQFASAVYTQGGSSLSLQVGSFDRDAKTWAIIVESSDLDFRFSAKLEYSIAGSSDMGAAYRAFDAAVKAGALAAEVDYIYTRMTGDEFIVAKSTNIRIKDLTTGKAFVSATRDIPLFYLAIESPGRRLRAPVLKLIGILEGSKVVVNGVSIQDWRGGIGLVPGSFYVEIQKAGYSPYTFSDIASPGSSLERTIFQKGNLSFDVVRVPGGTFTMGSPSTEQGRTSDEGPQHRVTLSSFMMGKYEISQEQYQIVMGRNPSVFTIGADAPKRPVEQVSWYDAVEFCNKLSDLEGYPRVYTISGMDVQADFNKSGYRLPTEAEWEYVARGASLSRGYTYAGSNNQDQVAWYNSNSGNTTHAVGTKAPNELGLYDMSGNVWEWCWDWFASSYESGAQTNPVGASSGDYRVIRGGSCYYSATNLRPAYRSSNSPGRSNLNLGFRVVRRP